MVLYSVRRGVREKELTMKREYLLEQLEKKKKKERKLLNDNRDIRDKSTKFYKGPCLGPD